MIKSTLFPNFSPADFAVSHFGPEVEQPQVQPRPGRNPKLRTEKEGMILRMMSSDVFLKGQMSLEDIAKVTQVELKLIKKIYRDLMR